LITVILMRCGLRIGDALRLPRDCMVRDADGAPYLRYFNHKMDREALVPIDEELEYALGQQHQRLQDRWPQGTPVLFPRAAGNPGGHHPMEDHTYRRALRRWLKRCDIRDEHGRPVHLTPHQWRHTLGTQFQPGRPPGGRAPDLGPRLAHDDSPVCPAVRYHHPPPLGSRPQGQHQRPGHHPGPGRPAGRGSLGQPADRPGHAGPAQRLLRAASGKDLPARQRLLL
jgi:integrase